MPNVIVVSDTSRLIAFYNLGLLHVLEKLYNRVIITEIVAQEFRLSLPDFIQVQNPSKETYQKILDYNVDEGEASAIALCVEIQNAFLLIDELKGRKIAEELGLIVTGTVGVLLSAKENEIIPALKPYLQQLRQGNFRLSEEVYRLALDIANEK